MEYFTISLVLLAAILGIFGETYNKKTKRSKICGWILIIVAVMAWGGNIYLTHKKTKAIKQEATQKQKGQSIAAIEIHRGIDELCYVFYEMYGDEEEYFFCDFLHYEPIFDTLESPEFIGKLNNTNMESSIPYDRWKAPPSPMTTIKAKITKGISNACESLDNSVKKFNIYLDAGTIQEVSAIQNHPFTRLMLRRETGPIINPLIEEEKTQYIDLIKRLRNLNTELRKGVTPQLLWDQEHGPYDIPQTQKSK